MDAPMEKRRNVWNARTTLTLAGGISWAMMAFAYRYDGGWGFRTWPRMMLLIFPALFFAARQWMIRRKPEKKTSVRIVAAAGAALILNGFAAGLAYADVRRFVHSHPLPEMLLYMLLILVSYVIFCLGVERWEKNQSFSFAICLCGGVILFHALRDWGCTGARSLAQAPCAPRFCGVKPWGKRKDKTKEKPACAVQAGFVFLHSSSARINRPSRKVRRLALPPGPLPWRWAISARTS